jgi:predicted nucleotidyltransferase
MNPRDPNILLLEEVAAGLGTDLLEEMVFVGGAVAGLLITDPAQPAIRPTDDVDVVVQAVALTDYHAIEARLRERGLVEDMSAEAPICRWRCRGVSVDVMPTLEHVLGFSNPWYPYAIDTAQLMSLPSGAEIRVIAAPAFIATKLVAFIGRGNGDYLFSHDLGDVISVVDGRVSLIDELILAEPRVRSYVANTLAQMLEDRAFYEALPGHLAGDVASQRRLPDLWRLLKRIAELGSDHETQSCRIT